MTVRAEVLKGGTAEVVWFHPQEGRPSATPSVAVKDTAGSTVTAAATTSVTQDTVNTTLSAGSSRGDRTVTLTAVTGLVSGRTYLITTTTHRPVWVTVLEWVDSTKVVTLRDYLPCDVASASTFAGTGFYRTLSSTEVASLAEVMRARATYVVGGVTYTMEVPFDVVLTPLRNPLTVDLLRVRHPDIMPQEHSETAGSAFANLRDAAFDEVMKGIRRHGWRPALLRTPDDIEGWALAEFRLLAWDAGIEVLKGDWDPERALAELDRRRESARSTALSSLSFYDSNEDDSKADEDERPLRMDLVR
jgi:hypothetical protein